MIDHITDSAPFNAADVDPDSDYQASVQSTIDKSNKALDPKWEARMAACNRDVELLMACAYKEMDHEAIKRLLRMAWGDGRVYELNVRADEIIAQVKAENLR